MTADLEHLLRKADRMGTTTSQMEIVTPRVNLNVAVTVASLDSPAHAHDPAAQRMGYVVVLEDITDLLRAQKQTAWSEVARRVAHEIKNPLTPIALSAERIRRHLERGTPPDAASLKIIRNCADTIGSSVQTVRTLVDEFATLARFPASRPVPSDINSIVESALLMFDGRLSGIRVQKFLASDLPPVHADPDAIKRAIANLVDNAAEAMQEAMVKEIVHLDGAGRRTRFRGDRRVRHRARRHAGGERKAVPALLLDQEARHWPGTGHRQPHHRRPPRLHPRGGERSHRDAVYRRVTCGGGDGRGSRPNNMHTILIVDDESEIRSSLQGVLEDEGYKTVLAESGEDCLATLGRKPVDVVLLDIWLPGIDGLEALERIVAMDDPPEVIMISGHGNIETAVRATKLGAFDFLEKPLSLERT